MTETWQEIQIVNKNEPQNPRTAGQNPDGEGQSTPRQRSLERKILENYSSCLVQEIEPSRFFRSDLLGEIQFQIPDSSWYEKNLSEREARFLHLFYEELWQEVLESGTSSSNILKLLGVYHLYEGRLMEANQIFEMADSMGMKMNSLHSVLFLSGYRLEGPNDPPESKILRLLQNWKLGHVEEEDRILLYDGILMGEYPELLGLAYRLFRDDLHGKRNVYPLEKMIKTRLRKFDAVQVEDFLERFESHHSLTEVFWLRKQFNTRAELREWVFDKKRENGRTQLLDQLLSRIDDREPLTVWKKYSVLKSENMAILLPPFEMLTLLNSEKSEEVRAQIEAACSNAPSSYLARRAMAILSFFQRDFISFQENLLKAGRFRFLPESVYLEGLSLIEMGKTEEGIQLLEALSNKFPQSDFLYMSIERYKKRLASR